MGRSVCMPHHCCCYHRRIGRPVGSAEVRRETRETKAGAIARGLFSQLLVFGSSSQGAVCQSWKVILTGAEIGLLVGEQAADSVLRRIRRTLGHPQVGQRAQKGRGLCDEMDCWS
jgi:hypothetical protein